MRRTPEGDMYYDIWDVIITLGLLAGIGMLFFL